MALKSSNNDQKINLKSTDQNNKHKNTKWNKLSWTFAYEFVEEGFLEQFTQFCDVLRAKLLGSKKEIHKIDTVSLMQKKQVHLFFLSNLEQIIMLIQKLSGQLAKIIPATKLKEIGVDYTYQGFKELLNCLNQLREIDLKKY